MNAGLPLTLTLTLSIFVGICPFMKSALVHLRVVPAKPEPFTSTQVFGAIVAASPSALATLEMEGAGAAFAQVDAGSTVVCPAIANRSRLARAYRSCSDVFPRNGLAVAGHAVACAYCRSLKGMSRYWIGALPAVPP